MASVTFKLDTVRLENKARELGPKIEHAVDATMQFGSVKGQAHMREHAPWTDRTGNARSGLFTIPNLIGKLKTITFSHTMSYGIWLEIKDNGKYAIIMPSVHKVGTDIRKSFERTLDRIT